MFEALILDVDGTLAETERDGHRVAFNRAFAEFALDWYWDVATYGKLLLVSGGKERIRHFVRAWRPPTPRFGDFDRFVADLHRCKTGHYGRIVRDNDLAPRQGIRRLVEEARARGVRLAIATTTSPQNVDALLGAWYGPGWRSVFPVVAAGDEVERKKPDRQIYDLVLARLGIAPADCVAIEDSAAGLASAQAAGVDVVVTRSEYFRHQPHEGALAVLDDLGEPGAESGGRVGGGRVGDLRWSGVVTLDTIEGWRAGCRRHASGLRRSGR